VIVLADGARWIWSMVEDLLPHAIQILDFSHVKQYLWEAGKLIYGEGSTFVAPWVKEQESLLLRIRSRRSSRTSNTSSIWLPPWPPLFTTLSRTPCGCTMGRIGSGGTLSARGRLRVRASSSRPHGLRGRACGGMLPR
jgi:hypothetical protein